MTALSIAALLLLWPLSAAATTASPVLAPTPPMGWNSWNHFGANVTAADVRHAADALVASGMAKAGYRYVIIDDGWQGKRDANGVLHPNAKFPDMRALADYIHGKGLKFGIYSSPGERTCGGFTGSYGHEAQDAKLFAGWGVDYLKYDLCSFRTHMQGKSQAAQVAMMKAAYRRMHEALQATGRPIVYSLCSYGWGRVWTWGAGVGGNLWRTTGDIGPSFQSLWFNALSQQGLEPWAGPGHWNDPDMLEIGNAGMRDPDMERTHMSLWALLAAPLIAGNDLAAMDEATRAVLTNAEVIAVDQDPLGVQGRQVWQQGPLRLWEKPLGDGTLAVGLFNTVGHPLDASLDFKALGLQGEVTARDLWTHRDLGRIDAQHPFTVPASGVVMLKLGAPRLQRSELARAGSGGYYSYRTPALAVTRDGTLIAACSAQVHSDKDLPNDIDVLVRTSRDGGRNWSAPLRVTHPVEGGGTSDTSLLVDRDSGRVFLFYAYGPPGIGFWNSQPGDAPGKTLHPRYLWSDDDGRTWQGPRDLLAAIKQPGWKGLFTASGHGIQLATGPHTGRLLQPLVHIGADGHIHASNLYSDDHGATWHNGASIGPDTDESKAVQLANGDVMQNMRSDDPRVHTRVVALSHDGGIHFGAPRIDTQLVDPHVNAGILRVDPAAPASTPDSHWLLFSNPDDAKARRNLTLRVSCDDGQHWSAGRGVAPGPSMYSTLARLPDGNFGILWEDGSGDLFYARFNFAWVDGGCG